MEARSGTTLGEKEFSTIFFALEDVREIPLIRNKDFLQLFSSSVYDNLKFFRPWQINWEILVFRPSSFLNWPKDGPISRGGAAV